MRLYRMDPLLALQLKHASYTPAFGTFTVFRPFRYSGPQLRSYFCFFLPFFLLPFIPSLLVIHPSLLNIPHVPAGSSCKLRRRHGTTEQRLGIDGVGPFEVTRRNKYVARHLIDKADDTKHRFFVLKYW